MMKVNLAILLVLVGLPLKARAGSQAIYWQKLMLEEKVQQKINNSLNTVLADNQFLVDVNAEVDEPAPPNFGGNGLTGPKVSDLKMEESRGDYIAFSKVGLEVPVLEKYFDEEKAKLMNLYRFNESYDIFKNLQSVEVTVHLSETLPKPLLEIAEKVVRTTRLSLGTVKPAFKFEEISLEWIDPNKKKELAKAANGGALGPGSEGGIKKKEEPVEPKIWTKDWFEWASRWGNAVGLILSSLIIGFLALSLFKRWKEFMDNAKAKENSDVQVKDDGSEDSKQNGLESSEELEMASDNGFERFKVCLSQYPVEASNVSREWIIQNSEDSRIALRAVAQQLSSEEFSALLSTLGAEQRQIWKSVIGAYLDPAQIKEANKIISRDVLKALLVPARIKDVNLLNMLMELGANKLTQFLEKNDHFSGILLNLLSPSVTTSLLNQVSEQKAEAWLLSAATFDMQTIESEATKVAQSLELFKRSLAPSHFNARLAELILTASPSRERMLFKSLAASSGPEEVIRVAQKLFPSELVMDLPASFLKETLQSYPMNKRLELLITREEDERQKLLNAFAEEGTTARDMMNMEIENINNDAGKLGSIQDRTEDVWREFLQFTRECLEKSPQHQANCLKLLEEWVGNLGSKLKMVSNSDAA
jgi:hypothetical protein